MTREACLRFYPVNLVNCVFMTALRLRRGNLTVAPAQSGSSSQIKIDHAAHLSAQCESNQLGIVTLRSWQQQGIQAQEPFTACSTAESGYPIIAVRRERTSTMAM